MRGKSKASGHRNLAQCGEREKPIISMDYAFLGIKKGRSKDEQAMLEEEAMKAGHTPQLVMHDSESKGIYAHAVARKGADEYLCRKVVEDLDNLGYKEVVFKSDQEPALCNFMDVVKANWNGDASLENSPVGESESNGAVERAIQTWEGQVRTMKDALEYRIGGVITPDHAIMTWLVQYAATLLRRCLVGSDGRTAHEKVKGRTSRRPVAEFGEKVWYKPLHTRKTKLDMVLEEGIFMGILDRSDEALVAVESGVIKCRDIRRQAAECRWDREKVMNIKVTPLAPTEGMADMRVKTYIQPGLANPSIPRPPEPSTTSAARRCKLSRGDFENFGTTIGCGGCSALTRGSSKPQNHTERCRARVEKELAKTSEGQLRLNQAKDRMNFAIAEKVEELDRKRKVDDTEEQEQKKGRIEETSKECDSTHQTLVGPSETNTGMPFPALDDQDGTNDSEITKAMDIDQGHTDNGMDVDWIEISEDLMPIKLVRGRSACESTLDFSLSQDPAEVWDFGDKTIVEAAWKAIRKMQPGFVIGSERVRDAASREKAVEELKNGARHVEELMDMYEYQRRRGMYFLHIHAKNSPTIGMSKVRQLENYAEVIKVVVDGMVYFTNCEHATRVIEEKGEQRDIEIGKALALQSKMRRGKKLSWADEMEEDLNLMELELNQVDEDEVHMQAWDDIKDTELDIKKVRRARKIEMEFVRNRKVYKYAKKAEAKRLGHKVIGVKWVDTNKGDDELENYRSRLVAQEFRSKSEDGLFAATPPLESLKALINIFVQEAYDDKGNLRAAEGNQRAGIMLIDIKRAHFYAPAQRRLFVELPPEDPRYGEDDICGELLQSLYGTRDASSNWEKEYTRSLMSGGFLRGEASPCHFWHDGWGVRLLVHGDDFFAVGPFDGLSKFEKHMEKHYECKIDQIGVGKRDGKQLRVLGRVITIEPHGVSYEADQRHVEAICQHLGIHEANCCATPWEKDSWPKGEAIRNKCRRLGEKVPATSGENRDENIEELQLADLKLYQSLSARLNYLALDRPDIQYSVKELMRKMSCPNTKDMKSLKRVARYLLGVPRLIQEFAWHRRSKELKVYVDSDFAGCQATRKSTSGGAITWGGSILKTWSKTQSVIALSTGEAELAAIVKGSTEAMGVKSLLADFGIFVDVHVCSDASAAIGMVMREGLGKVRHLAVADLWVQHKRDSGEITYTKIDGDSNPADMLTKGVNGEKIHRYLSVLGFRLRFGRHELTPHFKWR
jgi:hypothetical protein